MRNHRREHNHLEALLQTVRRQLEQEDLAEARDTLSILGVRLRAHLLEEELEVFPVVEAHVGDPTFSVTSALRREHGAIRDFLSGLEDAVAHGHRDRALGDAMELGAMVRLHQTLEEHALYPIADHATTG